MKTEAIIYRDYELEIIEHPCPGQWQVHIYPRRLGSVARRASTHTLYDGLSGEVLVIVGKRVQFDDETWQAMTTKLCGLH
jgi:hypothetical protein